MKKSFLLIFIIILISFKAYSKDEFCDVLVVGASQSGVMAAIQAARMGSKVILVSEDEYLGGSMIAGGVSAIDGNELSAFHTGLWGEFLARLSEKEKNLSSYGWVSLFTFNPQIGRKVLEDWIAEEKNIIWIKNQKPIKVLFSNNQSSNIKKVIGIEFSNNLKINAKITIDATELGDLLELGNIDYRLGWEYQGEFKERSAPKAKSKIAKRFPVQELTWVFFIKDYGDKLAPEIPKPVGYTPELAQRRFWCSFDNKKIRDKELLKKYRLHAKTDRFFSPESFITYGQISPDIFMINWPKCGNDYSIKINRIFKDQAEKERFDKEAKTYSLWFARYIQENLGRRFGLAQEIFPKTNGFAVIPYYREARRLVGFDTFTENDFIYDNENAGSFLFDSIAVGNYVNDHHYDEMAPKTSKKYFKPLVKSMKWGGRHTGLPFSIPMKAVIPIKTDGLIVAEKSFSVSHIANGVSRLQPVCMQIGQAVGAIAALSVQKNIQPFELNIKELQKELLNDKYASPTLVPLLDIRAENPYRNSIQRLILNEIIDFPKDLNFKPNEKISSEDLSLWCKKAGIEEPINKDLTRAEATSFITNWEKNIIKRKVILNTAIYEGFLSATDKDLPHKSFKITNLKFINAEGKAEDVYRITPFTKNKANSAGAITIYPEVYEKLQKLTEKNNSFIRVKAVYNHSGAWLLITEIE